jgi:predicted transcriptional regulator
VLQRPQTAHFVAAKALDDFVNRATARIDIGAAGQQCERPVSDDFFEYPG